MRKLLRKVKHKLKGTLAQPAPKNELQMPSFCLELRVDEKGLVYSRLPKNTPENINEEEFSQICQVVGNIALMEMRENNRVIH